MLDLLTAPSLSPWWLLTAGCVLLAVEAMTGGFFIMWFGVGALLVGLLSFFIPMYWWVQVALICMIAPIGILYTRRWHAGRVAAEAVAVPLNSRSARLIGRQFRLHGALKGGHGELFADDTRWDVTGPDLPAGSMVRVTGGSDTQLTVEAA